MACRVRVMMSTESIGEHTNMTHPQVVGARENFDQGRALGVDHSEHGLLRPSLPAHLLL
jgi:hypothetical protein